MALYQFQTTATMKEYNQKKWWIDSKIVPNMTIWAHSLREALEEYRETVQRKHYIDISDNAMRRKSKMYIDTATGVKQCGYVITGKTEFERNYTWVPQYIDLWVTIHELVDPFGGDDD